MRRFCRRAALGGRRVGLALVVALLAGLTSIAAGIPAAPPASALSTSGYWLVGTDGGIFSFGRAGFFGSTGAIPLNQPIAGMAATPDGRGYWMVASDGGIFAFGDAPFYGSMGSAHLNKPIVDIVPTPSGHGYWMAASDGGIFAFGDAGFFGSTGSLKLTKRIQQMAATPSGRGYWMVAGDGGVFAFGDASFFGSAADGKTDKRIVDIAPSATGKGYYMTASNGAVYAYGDATNFGGAEAQKLTHGIISMVALNNGDPPVVGDDTLNVDEDGAATADVLVNDVDPDGGTLSIQSVSTPAHGTATFAVGTVGYRPAPNFHGNDSFTYTVIDSQGNTGLGLVTVNVRGIDDLPRVVDDIVSVPVGGPTSIDVLSNDFFGDGLASLEIVSLPRYGSAALSADGRSIVYSPSKKGITDSLIYRIYDTDGDNAQGKVTINVASTDPKAVNLSLACGAGTCGIDVAQAPNVSMGDNGQVTMDGEQNGSVTVPGVGTFSRQGSVISFVAANGSVGDASVDYQIDDDNNNATGPHQISKAKVTFQYQNSAPTATTASDPAPPAANAPMDGHVSGADPDGDPITYLFDSVTGPGDPALFHFNPDGSFHFDGGPSGTWVITFRTFDGHANSSSATYTITVP